MDTAELYCNYANLVNNMQKKKSDTAMCCSHISIFLTPVTDNLIFEKKKEDVWV